MNAYDPRTQVEEVRERLATLERTAARVRLPQDTEAILAATLAVVRDAADRLIAATEKQALSDEHSELIQRDMYELLQATDDFEDGLQLILERVPGLRRE